MKRSVRRGAPAIRDAVLLGAAILLVFSVRFEMKGSEPIPPARAAEGHDVPAVAAVHVPKSEDLPSGACPVERTLKIPGVRPGVRPLPRYRFVVNRDIRCEVAVAPALSS